MTYITEQALRDQLDRAVKSLKAMNRPTNTDVLKNWTEQRIADKRSQGLLMTERQYADYKSKRGFIKGDAARYIGGDRDETLDDGSTHRRSDQQAGTIVSVTRDGETDIVTFRPDDFPEGKELIVRQGTPGYLVLERV